MSKPQVQNELGAAVPKFCLGLEVHRRTNDGRVRTPQEFLAHFFPHDKKSSTDRVFKYLPKDVRAPVLTTWGIRGRKSALLDDDAKVQSVVHDALVAGDIDASMFEEGLLPEIIVRWVELPDWWRFWRGGRITKYTILKALESAYDLELFDAEWFLATLRGHGGRLRGTDVLAEGLTKADLTEWVRRIHESGDGSPKGLISALGWDQIVAKTADDVLIGVLDAMALKVSLVVPEQKESGEAKAEARPEAKVDAAKAEAKAEPKASTQAAQGAKTDGKPDAQGAQAKAGGSLEKAESPTAKSAVVDGASDGKAVLPGILIPSTAVKSTSKEESIDSELAANLFKDDELIPISSDTWENVDGEEGGDGGERASRGSKPPGRRASKNPPAKGAK